MEQEKEQGTLKTVCNSEEELLKYLQSKAEKKKNYKIYSTLSSLEYKISESAIFLSRGGNWNDINDRNKFNKFGASEIRFGACFSFSQSENVAMWMLYGGIEQEGVMADFKQKQITDIRNKTKSIELGIWKNRKFQPICNLDRDKFTIHIIDVLYISESEKGESYFRIRRSDEINPEVPKEIVDSPKFIVKSEPWHYENECRLIISIPKKFIPGDEINSIKIYIPGLYETLIQEKRIYKAPNFRGDRPDFQESTLTRYMDWDLCSGCPKKELKEMQEELVHV